MLRLIKTAVLTLGITSAIPMFAQADRIHDDRDRHEQVTRDFHGRDNHREVVIDRRPTVVRERVVVQTPVFVNNDVDTTVALCDVPTQVTRTLDHQGFGRVDAVQFVRRDGNTFYRFRVEDGRRGCVDVRIAPDGDLLGVAQAY